MNVRDLLKQTQIALKKIKRLPPHRFISRLKLGIKKQIINSPQFITLQTVSACNLQCSHCFINDYRTEINDGVIKIMKYDEFLIFAKRLDSIIKNAEYFTFSSFEAILNKDLFRMMDHLLTINPSLKFPFLSNAMQLTPEKISQLEKYPVTEINISLDGMSKEVVESFKTGVHFETIIETLQNLKRSSLRENIAVTFVAHKNNIHELPGYVDFVNNIGVKTIYVSNILSFTQKTAHLPLYTHDGNPDAQQIFDEAVRRAKSNGQILQLPGLKPILKGCQACEAFFIDTNGNVAPCDFLAVTTPFTLFGKTVQNPPQIFGNVLFDDPLEIYRSERYTAFRNAHRLAKDLPEVCKNCIDGYGLMCSNRTVYQ